MARLNVNPNAEASVAFDTIKPGIYRMRVKEVLTVDQNGNAFVSASGNTCWRVRFEFADPGQVLNLSEAVAQNPGTLMDAGLVIDPAEKQGKLRGLVEALGMIWQDLDSDDMIGRECDVKVGLGEYKGEKRNEIKGYLKVS